MFYEIKVKELMAEKMSGLFDLTHKLCGLVFQLSCICRMKPQRDKMLYGRQGFSGEGKLLRPWSHFVLLLQRRSLKSGEDLSKLDRFTDEEKNTVQKIQKIFGEEADKYSMVLFTHGDQLKGKPIEEFLKDSEDLQELVARCNGQYHVFNNNLEDRSQVSELLNKIRHITEKNGESHYTTEMFQRAEKAIEEEKQRILEVEEEQMRKEREELRKKLEEEYEQKIRAETANRKNELWAYREREMEKKIKKLEDIQKRWARSQAEESDQLLRILFQIFVTVLSCCLSLLR